MNKKLEELAVIRYGKDYKSNPHGDDVPIYGTGGIMGYTSINLNSGPAVLTGRKGSINNPIYVEGDFWNVDTIFCIKPFNGVNTKWLYYNFLNTDLKKLNEATGVPSVNTQSLYRLAFKYFDESIQRKIAHILSTCDAVIEKTEAAIAKYQAIKQGMMHDLFTRGILMENISYTDKNGMVVERSRNQLRPKQEDAPELYKESELGWIPKEWEVMRLEEIAGYVDYRGKTPPKSDKGIYLVTAKNIKFGYIDYEISKEYIPISSYEITMSRGKTKIGDVLITTEAPMGNVAQIDVEGLALAQRVIKYRCTEGVMLNDYLKNSLLSAYFQRELVAESTGSTVKGIKGSRLHKLKVLVPLIQEQEFIIKRFSPIEKKIKVEQSTLSKYRQIKAGLMQDLLSGKVEVKVSDNVKN